MEAGTEGLDTAATQDDLPEYEQAHLSDQPAPLSIEQAAAALGRTVGALERGIRGKWGNKLPEGWSARRMPTENGWQWRVFPPASFQAKQAASRATDAGADQSNPYDSAGTPKHKTVWFRDADQDRRPAIIEGRQEVEYLLRELLQCQKQVSEERRLRLEDLRLIAQMQGSMRLLETRAAETAGLKEELSAAREEMQGLKKQYTELLNRPWWKRILKR